MAFRIHKLKDGTTVAITSLHGGKFSDGTECEGSPVEDVDKLTCHMYETRVNERAVRTKFDVAPFALEIIAQLVEQADIVWVSRPMLSALEEIGVRDQFPTVLGMNATQETRRTKSPDEKIIDVTRWAW